MPTKLGQNFLKDKTIAKRIVKAADLKPSDCVFEIGPGKGILTEKLAKHAERVIAVEIDGKLVDYLRRKFINQKNIEIIHGDILETNLPELATSYKVVANLPYYITSPVIRMFLEAKHPPRKMILMVQKEVAERITAAPGKMSLLSVSVQYYARPKILFYVDKKSFNPIPQVDSAVIKVGNIKHQVLSGEDKKPYKFFRVVRAGFCAKRKTLVNNLSSSLRLDKNDIREKLKAIGILPTARAQELSVNDWEKLSDLI